MGDNMTAVNTVNNQSIAIKFGGLIAVIFFIIYIPSHTFIQMDRELKNQQKLHEQYVKQTSDIIGNLSNEVNDLDQKYKKSTFVKNEVTCLADNIYHEIGVSSDMGMRAVAQVTLNRKREGFANTICGVVHQKSNGVCQFSWVCENHTQPPSQAYRKAYSFAMKTFLDGIALKSLSDALYFHADNISPKWKDEKIQIAHIGPHIFYAERE